MSMSDEQFESVMQQLENHGGRYAMLVLKLRTRDTALREALARVEAERDEAREFMRINAKSGLHYAEQQEAREPVLARPEHGVGLDEALALTKDRYSGAIEKLAASEQQEANGTHDLDAVAEAIFNADKDNWYSAGPYPQLHANDKARLRAMARAALATQPADGEPVATLMLRRSFGSLSVGVVRFDAGQLPRGTLVDVYAAPPAAAHGDKPAQYRLLRLGEVILATDELLMDDCATWQPISDGPQLGIGREWHAGLVPMRRVEVAERPQGDGDAES